MCCLFTIAALLGPRLAILIWWLVDMARFVTAVQTWPQPRWLLALLATLFLPWTSIAYLIVFPYGWGNFHWLWLVLGFVIDISAHSGGGYRHRKRIRGCA